jgi:uncharacterized protein DUF3667
VSHQPERKEKICLNCGTALFGRYCHICGQENIVTKQGFWALIKHFVYDIFHFDGKFFDTLKYLLFKPGIISKEYIAGKRTKYLDPIRMYLFTSAIFFLVFYNIEKSDINIGSNLFLSQKERNDIAADLSGQLKQKPSDTILKKHIALLSDTRFKIHLDSSKKDIPRNSLVTYKGVKYELSSDTGNSLVTASKINPGDSWIKREVKKKNAYFITKYGDNLNEGINRFIDIFLHKFQYLLFISLPFFAGILKMLYARNKKFYYSDHAIFTLHHYIISFILLMVALLFNYLHAHTGVKVFSYCVIALFIIWIVYLYLEMKNFYGQGWIKTAGKFILLNFLANMVLLFLFGIFFLFSFFQI